jgi:diaminopimelate decarboxylase
VTFISECVNFQSFYINNYRIYTIRIGGQVKIGNLEVEALANKYGTPLYVYDFEKIKSNVRRLQKSFKSDEIAVNIHYAMKANCHPAIISLILECGLGLDCVSPGELEVALKVGAKPKNIIYTANYESEEELRIAYNTGVTINLDDISSLNRLLKAGKPPLISYRINPGKGRGKHEGINTGGEKSKFGIPYERAVNAYRSALEAGINRFGAHIMTGSGLLEVEHFPEMLSLFLDELGDINSKLNINFEFIDMGGGFGIPYYDDKHELDIEAVSEKVINVFKNKTKELNLGNPTLVIEPGRYLVGDAGYLISRITGTKESYQKFVGIDAGFNVLIRPALYKAQHTVIVNGKESVEEKEVISICGQICENTDILARDRELPPVEKGDIVIFAQAGAYCSVMSMPYNLRLRPAEVAIIDGKDVQITRPEVMRDYWNRITYPPVTI